MTSFPYQIEPIPDEMMAVVTTGEGGYECLDYKSVPVPELREGDVLLRVLAAGVNNTDINTRLGWYAREVTSATSAVDVKSVSTENTGGWAGATPFPLIQGTDACGIIVASQNSEHHHLLGRRALIRACMRTHGFTSLEMRWMASNFDGAFAGYVAVPASEIFPIECSWSDAELATIPCSYATAETMLERAHCVSGSTLLVTGASGGVGSAAIQLAKRRGAHVIAITSPEKIPQIAQIGADDVIDRNSDLKIALQDKAIDIIVDNVAGVQFETLLKCLKPGGRYATSGAIAGPLVSLDMRDLYLNDITLIGSTAWDEAVFPNLVRYIEAGEISPILARTFALKDIVDAQEFFSRKSHIGNVVLLP